MVIMPEPNTAPQNVMRTVGSGSMLEIEVTSQTTSTNSFSRILPHTFDTLLVWDILTNGVCEVEAVGKTKCQSLIT